MTFVFAGIILLMAGGFFYLKIRVDRVVSGEEWIRKIRDEIDQLVLEMNQTAERNVALLEDRVKALQHLLDEADKKMKVLQKESDKNDLSRQVYSHLKKNTVSHPKTVKHDSENVVNLDLFDEARKPEAEQNPPAPPHEDVKEAKNVRANVMELYSQGFSREIISHKMGMTISEVDLIINLSTGTAP